MFFVYFVLFHNYHVIVVSHFQSLCVKTRILNSYCKFRIKALIMHNYVIISKLGSGTFGSVSKAIHIHDKTREIVAIKTLKQKYSSLDECMKLGEVQALSRLINHPNIIRLYSIGFQNNDCFLVFEYMDFNLRHLFKQREDKPFCEAEIRKWMLQILQGVEYMHKNGCFHRDLKPENLMVTKNVIKVVDFGLVAQIHPSGHSYHKNVGTIWYKAPEVLLLDSHYGAPVDMWAVGPIMVEFFTLQLLFQGKNLCHHLKQLCAVLGTPIEQTWSNGIKLASSCNYKFPKIPKVPLDTINASLEAMDLMLSLCNWDPSKRLTASQALEHPWFKNHEKLTPSAMLTDENRCLQST